MSILGIYLLFVVCSSCCCDNVQFSIQDKSGTLDMGSSVILNCETPTNCTFISHAGQNIVQNGILNVSSHYNYSISMKESTYMHSLTINGIIRGDSGVYTCTIITKDEIESKAVTLSVNYSPLNDFPVCTLLPNSTSFLLNERVDFSCKSERGFPHITFKLSNSKASLEEPFGLPVINELQTLQVKEILSAEFNKSSFRCFTEQTTVNYEGNCQVGPITIFESLEVQINETDTGDKITLVCSSNIPHANKTWIINGKAQYNEDNLVKSTLCKECIVTCQVTLGNITISKNITESMRSTLADEPTNSKLNVWILPVVILVLFFLMCLLVIILIRHRRQKPYFPILERIRNKAKSNSFRNEINTNNDVTEADLGPTIENTPEEEAQGIKDPPVYNVLMEENNCIEHSPEDEAQQTKDPLVYNVIEENESNCYNEITEYKVTIPVPGSKSNDDYELLKVNSGSKSNDDYESLQVNPTD